MQQTSPVGNDPATDSDSRTVETTGPTPTTAPEPTKVPSQNMISQVGPDQHVPGRAAPGQDVIDRVVAGRDGPDRDAPGRDEPDRNAPDRGGPGSDTPTVITAGPGAPAADAVDSQQFPPTLVGLDPPTLPAAEGMSPPHRDVDARGPADLPQFRPFPHPQRSEPGHPGLRRMWKRLLTLWRRTKI